MGYRVDKLVVSADVAIEFEGPVHFSFNIDPNSALADALMAEHERQLKAMLASSDTSKTDIFLG